MLQDVLREVNELCTGSVCTSMRACTATSEPGAVPPSRGTAVDVSSGGAAGLGTGATVEVTKEGLTVGRDDDMREDSLDMMCVEMEEEELSAAELQVARKVEDALSSLFDVLHGAAFSFVT
jgi:hypothetical protein